jgi:hypothetical protein
MKPATGSSTQKGYSFSLIISTKLFPLWNSDIRIEKNKKFSEKPVVLKFGSVVRECFIKASEGHSVV